MGWLWLALIGAVAFVSLRRLGVAPMLGPLVGVALMLGAAGYAWQGRAALAGRPVAANAKAIEVDPGQLAFRGVILPGTPDDVAVRKEADAHMRAGDTTAAARALLRAIERQPRSAALWTDLGGALAAHDQGQLSPAARFAFRRAWQLAPDQPGPPFFLGLAYVQAGDLPAAKIAWLRALRMTPRAAPWRAAIAERLVLIDEFQAMLQVERRGR